MHDNKLFLFYVDHVLSHIPPVSLLHRT